MTPTLQPSIDTILTTLAETRPDIPRTYSEPWLAEFIKRRIDNGTDESAIVAELAGRYGIAQQIGVAYDFDVVRKQREGDPTYMQGPKG